MIKRLLPQTLLSLPFNSFSGYFLRLQSGKVPQLYFFQLLWGHEKELHWKHPLLLSKPTCPVTFLRLNEEVGHGKSVHKTKRYWPWPLTTLQRAVPQEMRIKHSISKICYQNLSIPSRNKTYVGTYFGCIHYYPAGHWGKQGLKFSLHYTKAWKHTSLMLGGTKQK